MKKTRILLVEDETDVLQVNRAFLEEQGYEVCCAETLREARNCLWESPPDLVLLDVLLPDGSGYDFCREIREISLVPVIFLTCMGGDGHIVTGLDRGGDDYIIKPYSFSVLQARVAAQLRRRGTVTGEISLPPLQINLTSGLVRLNGETIDLTRKEFLLLLYLVENRGQELSQAGIYEAVWSAPPETMGNTVRMHVSRLRQKLRLDEGSAFELSAAGQNYIFLRTVYAP
ncbi:two component transcriptional regulator, winged helix family [Syntrophobotulus glycolicus DSM 8271]|uniref:Stage 0 sporulation protein A homolog n=1 Tax=Syntrophobotulus glycolicus (strain DSM 8271 / FlGlyR) TaxID=645991 RepID=F0SU40_SYNGF|nr:response regulator transcription factor [Syntrophobotulus glycolicus]ADY55423.1 two component transcriptional regulator, winged helix family [Syntrophobotulus glycolicus DSM 8271]